MAEMANEFIVESPPMLYTMLFKPETEHWPTLSPRWVPLVQRGAMTSKCGAMTNSALSGLVTSRPSGHQEKRPIAKIDMHVPVKIDVCKQEKT